MTEQGRLEMSAKLSLSQPKRGPGTPALEELHSTFVQNVEHELRTPLAMVQGYAELLHTGELGELAPEQKEAAFVIVDRAYQMRTIVDRIGVLLSSKARMGISIPISPAEVVAKVVEKKSDDAEKKGLTLQMHMDQNLPLVSGDPYQLQEALDCLLENAIKFTPQGGQVEVQGYTEPGWVCLVINDTGVGIEPNKLPYLGTGFYQVDGSITRRYGGLGLGLTLARSVVKAHSGKIEVESQPGQGSRFTVKLPRKPAPFSDDGKVPGDTRPPRILLVDDEENVILTMKAGLQMLLDCEAATATSGEQALRLLEEKPFDLLITDYKMPGMDGMTLSARVRQSYPHTGIVMITAYDDDGLRREAAQVPIQYILDKPVNLPDVRTAVLEVLNGSYEE